MEKNPTVFLCHAWEDQATARKLAEDLLAAGIDVFFADWSIGAGDSLRQKIDQGLESCTHFVALLTPVSIGKPWVQTEMDAGFMRRLEGKSRFIPLRLHLEVDELPPLLRGLLSPSLTNYEDDLKRLIGDIHEISRKPTIGSPPHFTLPEIETSFGLSPVAAKIAGELLRRSETGRHGDPQMDVEELMAATDLLEDDFAEGVEELKDRSFVDTIDIAMCVLGYCSVEPTSRLFSELDSTIMDWRPEEDAVRLAAELVNGGKKTYVPRKIEELGWSPRRANPALTYLIERGLVEHSDMVRWPLVADHIWKNAKTRRFVRSTGGEQPSLAKGSRSEENSLSFHCLRCGSTEFEIPENPQNSDIVTCAGCRATSTYGAIREQMDRQARAHVDDIVEKALGPLFKRR